MIFVLCFFAAIGLTDIMVISSIMEPVRCWLREHLPERILWVHPREAVDCHQCMGTWCGFVVGILYLIQTDALFAFMLTHMWVWSAYFLYGLFCLISYVLLFGFAGSFLSNFWYILFQYINSITEIPWSDTNGKPQSESSNQIDQAN